MSRLHAEPAGVGADAKIGFVFQSFNLLARTRPCENVHHAAGLLAARPPRPRPGRWPRPCSIAWDWATGSITSRRRCRAASSSGWPSRRALVNQPAAAHRRRADRQPRLAHQRGNAADVPAAQRRGDHGAPGDARSQGGRLRPPDDPHRRRPDRQRRGAATPPAKHAIGPARRPADPDRASGGGWRQGGSAGTRRRVSEPRGFNLPSLRARPRFAVPLGAPAAQQTAFGLIGLGHDYRRRAP